MLINLKHLFLKNLPDFQTNGGGRTSSSSTAHASFPEVSRPSSTANASRPHLDLVTFNHFCCRCCFCYVIISLPIHLMTSLLVYVTSFSVFHNKATVSIGLKNVLRMVTSILYNFGHRYHICYSSMTYNL